MLTSSKRVLSNTETYTAVPESRGDKLTAFQGLYTVQAKPQFPVKPGTAPNIQSQTQSMESPQWYPSLHKHLNNFWCGGSESHT